MSLLQEALFKGWEADTQHPGYLTKCERHFVLRVPFHLLSAFPPGDFLDHIWRISRLVKTDDQSVICISGSSATFEVTKAVTDIDFCEYIKFEKHFDGGANCCEVCFRKRHHF
jgi:hypothetical protein